MPESFPNWFTAQDNGDVATSFLLLASDGAGGPVTADRVMNWGSVAPHMNGSVESDTTTIAHGLGVVPIFIGITPIYDDIGRFIPFLRADMAPDTNVFYCFWRDLTGAVHGPGTENQVYQWMAIG